jgi:hypothetical protein
MKSAIVTFANNEERYIKGQKRQEQSLKAVGWDGDYYAFSTFEEIGSPPHDEVPYAFKPFAIEKVRQMGYDVVLWMDAPVYATKPLWMLAKEISDRGVLLFDNLGFTIGDFTSDKCLELMNLSRSVSFTKPMIMACVMGFDFRVVKTRNFFKDYLAGVYSGAYEGDWNNNNGQVSTDPRVKGHRHDQSVASIIASKMGIKPLHPHSTYFAYHGNPGHLPHAETVCLISHGY